jgi:hypothetical protein
VLPEMDYWISSVVHVARTSGAAESVDHRYLLCVSNHKNGTPAGRSASRRQARNPSPLGRDSAESRIVHRWTDTVAEAVDVCPPRPSLGD